MNHPWRVGHEGRDTMFYEENHDGTWRRIAIDAEMLTGRAHHVIYFADPETWQRYPEWARHRRDEIVARIKSRFREPDYAYADVGTAAAASAAPAAGAVPASPSASDGRILPMLACLVVVAAACCWFAARGLERGEIRLPVKHNPASRTVSLAEKPVLYWTSITLLGGVGLGSSALSAWLLIGRIRNRR